MNTAIQTDTANRPKGLSRNRAAKKRRRQNAALWILQGLLAIAFVMAGFAKLTGDATMIANFEQLGLGQWFHYLTGSIEVVFGALLLVSLLAPLAAAVLACTMLGATLAHLMQLGGSPLPAIVLGALCAVVVRYRWEGPAMSAPAAPARAHVSV